MRKHDIAIIGAGLSGLVLADLLRNHCNITIFEKARGVGGRLATRYNEIGHQFDIGAQFFIAKSNQFKQYISSFIEKKLLVPWEGKFIEIDRDRTLRETRWYDAFPHYVASPKMTSWCKALATDHQLHLSTRICNIISDQGVHYLKTHEGVVYGPYIGVLLAIPVAQAIELLPKTTHYLPQLNRYSMMGCFSLMLGFSEKLPIDFCAALVKNSDISWISNNATRPGGNKRPPSLTVLSTNIFADSHAESDHSKVMEYLENVTFNVLKSYNFPSITYRDIHHWHYANMKKVIGPSSFFDSNHFIGVCGDWCHQGLVEAAYLTAHDLSERIRKFIIFSKNFKD